jgi:hypothetical protein
VNVDYLKFKVPGKNSSIITTLLVPKTKQGVIAGPLDYLPWNHLLWRIQRGMHDILLAYSKLNMDRFRFQFAILLKRVVFSQPHVLKLQGWESNFVRNNMDGMTPSAVLLGMEKAVPAILYVS